MTRTDATQGEEAREQLARVEMMASGDPTWDLSDNDLADLTALLSEREELLERVARAEEALRCADNLAEAVDAASRVDATDADHRAMYVCRTAYARARKEATP